MLHPQDWRNRFYGPVKRATPRRAVRFLAAVLALNAALFTWVVLDPGSWRWGDSLAPFTPERVAFDPASVPLGLTRVPCWAAAPADDLTLSCAFHVVPQDPDDPASRRIARAVVTLTPAGATNRSDAPPIIYLEGGPGGGATPPAVLEAMLPVLGALSRASGRAIVVPEHRGAGNSHPAVDCPAYRAHLYEVQRPALNRSGRVALRSARRDCSRHLVEIGVDLSLYSSRTAARDLETLRVDLGAERIALLGASYGGVLAQQYAATFPERVEALILDSSPPAESARIARGFDPAAARRALEASCANSAHCRPDALWRRATHIFRYVDWRIVEAPGYPENSEMVTAPRKRGLYGPAVILKAVHLAGYGDYRPGVADSLLAFKASEPETHRWMDAPPINAEADLTFSPTLNLAVLCNDGVPEDTSSRRAAPRREVDLPAGLQVFARPYAANCADMGLANGSDGLRIPPANAGRPILILAGALDTITPLRDSQHIADGFQGSAHLLTFPAGGHVVFFERTHQCALQQIADFLAGARPTKACAAAAELQAEPRKADGSAHALD